MLKKTLKGKRVITFNLPEPPPSLNVMLRTHWRERSRIQRLWEVWVYKEWLRHNRFMFYGPIKLKYVLIFAKRRTRDFDNYIGGTKYITDALKQTFFTKDDSGWLKKLEIEFSEGEPATQVFIEDAE